MSALVLGIFASNAQFVVLVQKTRISRFNECAYPLIRMMKRCSKIDEMGGDYYIF